MSLAVVDWLDVSTPLYTLSETTVGSQVAQVLYLLASVQLH